MTVEVSEITDFLAHTPPFDSITDDHRARVARNATMFYVKAGEKADATSDTSHSHSRDTSGDDAMTGIRIVRSGAINCFGERDQLVDRFGPGEIYPRRVSDKPTQHYSYWAHEDSLLIEIPVEVIESLQNYPEVTTFFGTVTTRRRSSANELRETSGTGGVADIDALRGTVGEVAVKPVIVSPETTIRDTATKMSERKLSSAIVVKAADDDQRPSRIVGIVTDATLRSEVLAKGADPSGPVERIMSPKPMVTYASMPLFEGMLQLTEARVNHLPVIDDDNVVGVLTTGAVMRQLQGDPIFAAAQFREARTDQLSECFDAVIDVAVRFIDRGATPYEATRLLTLGTDEMMKRVIELVQEEIGPAPVPFCLVVMGSLGRSEMVLSSDQDHAIILSDEYDPDKHGFYFKQLGEKFSSLVAQAGLPVCPGDMMASNSNWRLTASAWEKEFSTWTDDLGPKALMKAQTFFDMRPVVGDSELCDDVRSAALMTARRDRRFLNALVKIARHREPPLGFFRGFVLDRSGNYANTLDIKRGGLTAVVQLARLYAIQAWVDEVGTRDRLRAAARAGVISHRRVEDLVDAFDIFQLILLANQASQWRDGKETNARIDPDSLAHLERESLRDAFRLVRSELKSAESSTGL
ncbi:DUF294 nucleotidyltransferase-like domain-containing protein [uncultured Corynebacterium sp.]|uniref:DUF294 nucleotidyltransferase-like domain-containing protein n=1 Tax=uncultured Corynebacterium sp. TaxID=159447 RepID=UPI002804D0F7|nr:DUF294 nucleotidyltransferase-like domain-containing protein [uncultured Corynebacterium sp.]